MKVDRNARTWCEISLPALRNNLRALRRCLPAKNKILAVVKDDAYGHGLIPVGRTLAQAGCEEFGVACVSEESNYAKQASANLFFFRFHTSV